MYNISVCIESTCKLEQQLVAVDSSARNSNQTYSVAVDSYLRVAITVTVFFSYILN